MNQDTDSEWERWGKLDPYYGVITHPRFRREALTNESRNEFFGSGAAHVEYVMQMLRLHLDPHFAPGSVLDFGCGVGRTLIPFARVAERAVGLDVAPSMLSEARANAAAAGVANVDLRLSDDDLSQVTESYELVHSFIVFQHLEPERGKKIFGRLIGKVAPGGMAAIHALYSKSEYSSSLGVPPSVGGCDATVTAGLSGEPEMQMNAYGATELMFMIQGLGVNRVHIEFTDHGGELGMFFFFRAPG
jgi:SAM-dependent methyltransferase